MQGMDENRKAPKKMEFIFQLIMIASLLVGGILQKTRFAQFSIFCWIVAGVVVILWIVAVNKDKKETDKQ